MLYIHIYYMIILLSTIVVELQTCTYPITPRARTDFRLLVRAEAAPRSAQKGKLRRFYKNMRNIFNKFK